VFQFFVNLDVNQSGGVSRLELKTGVQQLGLHITSEEFDSLWNVIYKPVDRIHHESPTDARAGKKGRRLEPDVEQATYIGFISAFAEAGCVKL
jgi:Ca2+-binding EF-hand superfamily protein